MKDGFIKVAAGTPDVQVADCEFNASEIIKMVHGVPGIMHHSVYLRGSFLAGKPSGGSKETVIPHCRRDKRCRGTDFRRTSAGIQGQAL